MDQQGFQEWLNQILSMGQQYQLTDEDIANLSQMMLYQNAYQGQQQFDLSNREFDLGNREIDYKNDYLNFQTQELGLRGMELEQAMKELEFQSGPYFEFYKENEIAKLQASTQQSQDDVARSANYLQQQRYGTEAAGYNRDIARYQAMQALGLAPPDTRGMSPGEVTGNKMFNAANMMASRG